MIRIEDVTKRYAGGHDALKGLSLHVEPGEMVIVRGAERIQPGQSVVIKESNDHLVSGDTK